MMITRVMGGDITDLLALEQLSGGRGAKIHPQPVSEEEPSRQSQSPFKMVQILSLNKNTISLQVIMVRKDLGMSTGKVAAQVGHAVLEAFKAASTNAPILVFEWEQVGSAKIVLQVKDQQELTTIGNAALENGLIVAFIKDAGRTQVNF
jgi:peptidyl-tRNA hydrolase, PTH2 family